MRIFALQMPNILNLCRILSNFSNIQFFWIYSQFYQFSNHRAFFLNYLRDFKSFDVKRSLEKLSNNYLRYKNRKHNFKSKSLKIEKKIFLSKDYTIYDNFKKKNRKNDIHMKKFLEKKIFTVKFLELIFMFIHFKLN